MPDKLDVEVYDGEVVAVWFGCLALPFEIHKIDAERCVEMRHMSANMNESIKNHTYDPTAILTKRLERAANGYRGYDNNGNIVKASPKYTPPSDEIKSREE